MSDLVMRKIEIWYFHIFYHSDSYENLKELKLTKSDIVCLRKVLHEYEVGMLIRVQNIGFPKQNPILNWTAVVS